MTHRSHTDSMIKRPRPPPVIGKLPLPLIANRCTETFLKFPVPKSLKLPPPYAAKLRQLNDQLMRQRPGAVNSSPTSESLPRRSHRTAGSRRAVVDTDKVVVGSTPSDLTRSACGSTATVVTGLSGRGATRGHRATTAATNSDAKTKLSARKATQNRRYHGDLGISNRRSLLLFAFVASAH